MRYLVRARVKPGSEGALLEATENRSLGEGSVAEGEYLRNMADARLFQDDTARWVEVCYCPTPLQEEKPYWEQYFELTRIQDAHDRSRCRDQNGSEAWACGSCDCTIRLEQRLKTSGKPFLDVLRNLAKKRWRIAHPGLGRCPEQTIDSGRADNRPRLPACR
jgi:hypothetical protein